MFGHIYRFASTLFHWWASVITVQNTCDYDNVECFEQLNNCQLKWRTWFDPQSFTCVGTAGSRLVTVSRLVSVRDGHSHSSIRHSRPLLQVVDERHELPSQPEQPSSSSSCHAERDRLVLALILVYRIVNIPNIFSSWHWFMFCMAHEWKTCNLSFSPQSFIFAL